MIGGRPPKAITRSIVMAGLALLFSLGIISWLAISTSNEMLFPELVKKAAVEADQAQRKINHALSLGIPARGLRGTDTLFADMRQSDGDIAFIGLIDTDGATVFAHGISPKRLGAVLAVKHLNPSGRRLAEHQTLRAGFVVTALSVHAGTFYLAHEQAALTRPLIDNLFDIGVVVLVTMLLAFEVMLLVMTVNFMLPAKAAMNVLRSITAGRFDTVTDYVGSGDLGHFVSRLDAQVRGVATRTGTRLRSTQEPTVIGVRLLAFLFVFSEELGRSFLPGYVSEYAASIRHLDKDMATGLVIGLHMIVVALTMPVAGMVYARLGRVKMYAIGALIASAGLVGTALAAGYWDLLVWRALSAVGYAVTFIACQGFVLETTSKKNRTQGAAMMVGGITLADICGPAFGGVFAERFGQSTTFLVAAVTAVLAAMLVSRLMASNGHAATAPRAIVWRDFMVAFRNRRLVLQLLLAALPAKFLLTGFLFYLVPVSLLDAGYNESDIGRVIMIYGIAMMIGGPLFARLVDRWHAYGLFIAAGGMISAASLVFIPLVPPDYFLAFTALCVAGLGFGQSISISAQVSMVVGLSADPDGQQGQYPELVVLRFVERLGGGVGPIIAATLGGIFGNAEAIMLFGIGVMGCFFVYTGMILREMAGP